MLICQTPGQHRFLNLPRSSNVLRPFLLSSQVAQSGSSLGSKVPFYFFSPHSPGPEQMVRLCWLSSLLCFHGNMGHRDHLCLGLPDSILWLRTSPWPLLLTFLLSRALQNILGTGSLGHFRDPLRTYSLQRVINWLETGRGRGSQYPSQVAEVSLGWQHIWIICPISHLPQWLRIAQMSNLMFLRFHLLSGNRYLLSVSVWLRFYTVLISYHLEMCIPLLFFLTKPGFP